MGSSLRRQVIENSMQQDERLAVEGHLRSQRQQTKKSPEAARKTTSRRGQPKAFLMLADSPYLGGAAGGAEADARAARGNGGICKSVDGARLYGYYAKAGIRNLVFWAPIRRELADAIRDHIVLVRILERIRGEVACKDFPAVARAAVGSVLTEEGLDEGSFLRNVSVTFSAYHWVGRELSVHSRHLHLALAAWETLEIARGARLFRGPSITAAYTPQRAAEQWSRLREAFVRLSEVLGGQPRARVEARIASLQAAYRPVFQRKSALYWHQWKKLTQAPAGQPQPSSAGARTSLILRLEAALRAWRREASRRALRARRASAREQKTRAEISRKRRWDGKESLAAFERRVLGQS